MKGRKIRRFVEKNTKTIIELVYPRHCPICDSVLAFNGGYVCRTCYKKIDFIKEPRCKKCGKQLEDMAKEYCYDCKNKRHLFETGVALVSHRGSIRNSIYGIKYDNKRENVDFFVEEIVKRYQEEIRYWEADVIIAVPLHRRKLINRGFNQAEVIAKRLSKKTGIPYEKNLLVRVKYTRPQKELNDIGRKKNLLNAFEINKKNKKHFKEMFKKIIIVDDIYTTGSTIDACADTLISCGAEKVYFICLSVGLGY